MKRKCVECGKEFELPQSEINFFKKKGLNLPKRCKECREKKKLASANGADVADVADGGRTSSEIKAAENESGKAAAVEASEYSTAGGRVSQQQAAGGESFFIPVWMQLVVIVAVIAAIAAIIVFGFYPSFSDFSQARQEYDEYLEEFNDTDGLSENAISGNAVSGNAISENGVSENTALEDEEAAKMSSDASEEAMDEDGEEAEDEEAAEMSSQLPAVADSFRNTKLLQEHYEKHGIEMGFDSPEAYEEAAAAVVANPASLNKKEAEDNDDIYYLEDSNEIVFVSSDGYIRTYFCPNSGREYYDRQ